MDDGMQNNCFARSVLGNVRLWSFVNTPDNHDLPCEHPTARSATDCFFRALKRLLSMRPHIPRLPDRE